VTFGGNNGSGIAMVSVWRTDDDRQLYTFIYPSTASKSTSNSRASISKI
jgi:hypothetical protein